MMLATPEILELSGRRHLARTMSEYGVGFCFYGCFPKRECLISTHHNYIESCYYNIIFDHANKDTPTNIPKYVFDRGVFQKSLRNFLQPKSHHVIAQRITASLNSIRSIITLLFSKLCQHFRRAMVVLQCPFAIGGGGVGAPLGSRSHASTPLQSVTRGLFSNDFVYIGGASWVMI